MKFRALHLFYFFFFFVRVQRAWIHVNWLFFMSLCHVRTRDVWMGLWLFFISLRKLETRFTSFYSRENPIRGAIDGLFEIVFTRAGWKIFFFMFIFNFIFRKKQNFVNVILFEHGKLFRIKSGIFQRMRISIAVSIHHPIPNKNKKTYCHGLKKNPKNCHLLRHTHTHMPLSFFQ